MAAADAEPLRQERIPPGVHLVDDVRQESAEIA